MEFKEVNPKEYVEYLMQNGVKPGLFIKAKPVIARRAKEGELIIPMIKDKETGNLIPETTSAYIAKEGDWVIQNIGGEIYHNSDEEFHRIYGESCMEGERIPLATPRLLIQVPENICFPDPWTEGSLFNLQAGGYLNLDNENCIYGVDEEKSNETHIPYNPESNDEDNNDESCIV